MRRKEFAARVWSKLIAFEKREKLLRPGDKVLAGVSGGPDSVCLAHYLASRRRRLGFTLALLHVHHGLRGRRADRDAAFVRRLGKTLGTVVTVSRAAVAAQARKRGKGLEDAGRELRYAALARRARKLGFNKVATGHQLDDQAETVLLHLLRGTRLAALGGMSPRRALAPGVELIRPLLALSRADVEAYLDVHELSWREDESNADPKFTRNWIRREALPLLERRNPRLKERLAGLSDQVRRLT
jgi:tRNA(Ile)-lysidine synthase